MGQRRFTRLTNGFSKKLDNHVAAVALYVAHYNLCRVHEALKGDPSEGAGHCGPHLGHWGAYRRGPCHAAHYTGSDRTGAAQTVHGNQRRARLAAPTGIRLS
jgi:hypothetical protein